MGCGKPAPAELERLVNIYIKTVAPAMRVSRAEARQEVENILLAQDAARFEFGPGIVVESTPGVNLVHERALLLERVRRAMARSRSFCDLMRSINTDAGHKLTIVLMKGTTSVDVDGFDGCGRQRLDMKDIVSFPDDPPAAHPSAATKEKVLAHIFAEARAGALDHCVPRPTEPQLQDRWAAAFLKPAHEKGIDAQNAYRRDIGQKGKRLKTADAEGVHRYSNGYQATYAPDTVNGGITVLHEDPE